MPILPTKYGHYGGGKFLKTQEKDFVSNLRIVRLSGKNKRACQNIEN
jgi:hypothetical protein